MRSSPLSRCRAGVADGVLFRKCDGLRCFVAHQWFITHGRRVALPKTPFLKDVPAWALPGGKERPSLVGTFGWLQGKVVLTPATLLLFASFDERPRLGWARRKTHPSRGEHSSNRRQKALYSSPAFWPACELMFQSNLQSSFRLLIGLRG